MLKTLFYTLILVFISNISFSQHIVPSLLVNEIQKGSKRIQKKIRFQKKKKLQNPGKIYHFGKTLYINDKNRGIHIIDNSNPRQPQFKKFVTI